MRRAAPLGALLTAALLGALLGALLTLGAARALRGGPDSAGQRIATFCAGLGSLLEVALEEHVRADATPAALERARNALGVGSVALASAGPLCLGDDAAARFGLRMQTLREGRAELAPDEAAALLREALELLRER